MARQQPRYLTSPPCPHPANALHEGGKKREYPPWRTDGFAINPQGPRYGKGRGPIREAVCDF
jgi:hypothetical protein